MKQIRSIITTLILLIPLLFCSSCDLLINLITKSVLESKIIKLELQNKNDYDIYYNTQLNNYGSKIEANSSVVLEVNKENLLFGPDSNVTLILSLHHNLKNNPFWMIKPEWTVVDKKDKKYRWEIDDLRLLEPPSVLITLQNREGVETKIFTKPIHSDFKLPPCDFTYGKKLFSRWVIDPTNSDFYDDNTAVNFYYDEQTIKVPPNAVFCQSKWLRNGKTVLFNANDHSGRTLKQNVEKNHPFTLRPNEFQREGISFLGWATEANALTPTFTDSTTHSGISNDLTLYAIWDE